MNNQQTQPKAPSQRETANVLDILNSPIELAVTTDEEMAALIESPACCPFCGRNIERVEK